MYFIGGSDIPYYAVWKMISVAVAFVNTSWYGCAMNVKKNRQSWLNAGLQELAEKGPGGLRIMPIADQLGVTKGSFYWHFKNLEEYQLALLEEWENSHTQQAIECVESMGGEAGTKLRHWLLGSVAADFTLERSIRIWSLVHGDAKEKQTRVDQKRIDYLSTLLLGVGWSKEEASTLGRWAFWAWVGYSTIEGPPVTQNQIKLILDVLTPK